MASDYQVKPLDVSTWDAFSRLVERHNGVFGGCWCTWFHTFHAEKTFTVEGNHALKKRLVEEDGAHAALVFDGDEAVAWAQFGPPGELPNIHHRKEYEEAGDPPPDYRITCIFVDKKHRRNGVTAIALRGAVDLIAEAGGGVVEGTRTTRPTARRSPSSTTPRVPSTSVPASTTSARKASGTASCAGSCPEFGRLGARILVATLTCRTRRRNTAGMHSCRFQLLLLAVIILAGGSTTAGSSAGVRDSRQAARLRGSILFASNHGIYRRYPGGALKQLTTSANDAFPVWSRDGTRIAFEQVAPPSLSCPLMVMNSDGSGVHQVGQVTTDCSGAGWGPQDRQLVFGAGPQGGNNASLWVVNADGTGLRRILQGSGGNPEGTHPSWSPDGRTIVVGWTAGRLNGVLAMRPDGSHLRALVKPRRGKTEAFSQPTWSRNGKRLAFVRVEVVGGRRTIMVSTSSGRSRRALARLPLNPGGMGTPSWSPSGSLIAFSGPCGPRRSCVWTIPSGGGTRRMLMRGTFQQANWGPART